MPAELVCATSVAWRASAQVRRPLTNREVEALDERRVQGLGILRRRVGIRHGDNNLQGFEVVKRCLHWLR